MTDADWANKSPREQDAVVAEAFGHNARECGCGTDGCWREEIRPGEWTSLADYTFTWAGAGMVVDEMIKSGPSDCELTLVSDGGCSTAIWCHDGLTFEAAIEGPPDKAAPSAIALVAVRAVQAENGE